MPWARRPLESVVVLSWGVEVTGTSGSGPEWFLSSGVSMRCLPLMVGSCLRQGFAEVWVSTTAEAWWSALPVSRMTVLVVARSPLSEMIPRPCASLLILVDRR